ncbi:MAG: 3-isopropylmalate dehydratase small subunit [Magnetovibrio sp.]|nr:3-isopropylmalate dehydratase small subunit [Magnetovibrio sp.]
MEKFTTLTGVAAPLMEANINTDIIIPIKRLVGTDRSTMGAYAFEPWRYRSEGVENPDFVLNQDGYRDATILIAGPNFACGSSREGAVWALDGIGIKAVIAPSFGGIFFNNCFQSGILPIVLAPDVVDDFAARAGPGAAFTIDLEALAITPPNGQPVAFEVEPFRRAALLAGLDDVGMTLKRADEIAAFQDADRVDRPWIYPA